MGRRLAQSLPGGEGVQAGTGGLGEGIPVGLVDHQNFGGFCHGEEFEAVCAVYITIRQVAGDILVQFLLGEVPFQGGQKAHLVNLPGSVGIGGKNVGHLCRPHLALCGIGHRLDEVVDPAFAGGLHHNAQLLAGGLVERLHQVVKGDLLGAVVVMPHGDGNRFLGVEAIGGILRCAAPHQQKPHCHNQCQASAQHRMFQKIPSKSYVFQPPNTTNSR